MSENDEKGRKRRYYIARGVRINSELLKNAQLDFSFELETAEGEPGISILQAKHHGTAKKTRRRSAAYYYYAYLLARESLRPGPTEAQPFGRLDTLASTVFPTRIYKEVLGPHIAETLREHHAVLKTGDPEKARWVRIWGVVYFWCLAYGALRDSIRLALRLRT
jgi:hypothetical protein